MKKIIGITAVAAMVASSAFAGITFGAWGRSGLDFGNVTTSSTKTESGSTTTTTTTDPTSATLAATPSWANGSRIGFNVAGQNDDGTVGFKVNVDSNGSTIGIGDQAKVWGKIGFLEVQFGKIQLDDLRGSIGDWGNREEYNLKAEDSIFTRFNPQKGMTIALRPVDGLFIGAAIDTSSTSSTTTVSMEDAFKAVQAGMGYTIKDVAQIKAQYIGNATTDHYGKLEFGTDLLMIKNNLIEIGVKLPMSKDSADGYFNAVVGFSGSADKLTYKGHVFGDFTRRTDHFDATAYKVNPTVGFDACGEYDIGVCSLGATGSYEVNFYTDSQNSNSYSFAANTVGIELYAKKGFSNGYLFAGVGDKMEFSSKIDDNGTKTTTTSFTNTFNIPVGAEYWF